MGPLALTDDAALQIPSGDETGPGHLPGTVSIRPPFGFIEYPWESTPDVGVDRPASNAQTPTPDQMLTLGRRLGAVAPKRVRAESRVFLVAGDDASRERHQLMTWGPVDACTINVKDMQNAIRPSVVGWTQYEFLFPLGELGRLVCHHISNEANSRGSPPEYTFARVGNVDPLSGASEVAGARIVPTH